MNARCLLPLALLWLAGACLAGPHEVEVDDSDPRSGGKADDLQPEVTFDSCLETLRANPAQQASRPTELECRGDRTDLWEDCDDVPSPDLRRLAEFPSLERVVLTGLCVRNLSGLELLPKLAELDLSDNDLSAAWSPVTPTPFAQLHSLDTLTLSRTQLGSLAPIAKSPRLRSLTINENELLTLRGLSSLRTLRELNIADTYVSELQPLKNLPLTYLNLTDNLVSNLEPVRAAIDGGATMLVDGNCIASCSSYGERVECGDQSPENHCYNIEAGEASGEQLSVPTAELPEFLPQAPTVWTWAQAVSAFELVKTAPDIDWTDAPGNCDGRAIASTALLDEQGYPTHYRIGSYGALRALAPGQPMGFVSWSWHVANAVFVDHNGELELYVLDPALFPAGPARGDQWFARQVDSAGAALDFNCERYNEQSGWGEGGCDDSPMVDDQGDLRVSRLQEITGVVCSTMFTGSISVCGTEP